MKATIKELKRTRAEAFQRLLYFVSQLEGRIREGDQFWLLPTPQEMDVESIRTFTSQYLKNKESRLPLVYALTRERWVRWFNKLLGIKLPTLDSSIVDELQQWPPCRPLDDVPSRYEVEEAIRALANRKAVGPDGPPFELLKVLADDRELNTLGNVHDTIVAVWRGGGVPQQWKRCSD